MTYTRIDLINWLKQVDKRLEKPMTLVALGGTAMVLLSLKESTKDVNFCIEGKDSKRFEKLTRNTEFKVAIFEDGFIFSEKLPDDYVKIADECKDAEFKNITLKTLNPIDIIVSKVARYNARDDEDMAILTKVKKIDKDKLIKRFNEIKGTFTSTEENIEDNFKVVLRRYFS